MSSAHREMWLNLRAKLIKCRQARLTLTDRVGPEEAGFATQLASLSQPPLINHVHPVTARLNLTIDRRARSCALEHVQSIACQL